MNSITQNTMIPIGLSILVIGTSSFWLAGITSKVDAHERSIIETKIKHDKTNEDLNQIRIDIGVIKQLLIKLEDKDGK